MRFRSARVSSFTVLLVALTGYVVACSSDDPASKGKPQGEGGEQHTAAGAPSAAGEPNAAGGETSGGGAGAGGADTEQAGGAGGQGEEQLPTFDPYSYDVLLADYYGDEGLFRLTLSDTGAGKPKALFTAPEGQRTFWHRLHGDAVILTLQDDTYGHLYRQPLAGGDAARITHDLAEHEIVEKWATVGDSIYYAVGTFMGNSHTHPAALWKAVPGDDGYSQTQVTLPEPSDAHSIYDLLVVGDWLYLPGFVSAGTGGYVLDRLTISDDDITPVDLLDYDFDMYRGGDVLTYRGQSEAGSYGVYAADLNQKKPVGVRLSPDNVPLANNAQLHSPSKHFFFSTKPEGEGELGYVADLSTQPFKVTPLLQSEETTSLQYGNWSTKGRYFYLHEGMPGQDVATYVVDMAEATPTPRATPKSIGADGWISSSPDDRLYAITRPQLWVMKPGDDDFALRIDQEIERGDATVDSSAFSSDGYHIWFALSDGRNFIDDTLESTPPHPVEVTPADLPEGWAAKNASQVPHGGFLLAVSSDDTELRDARQNQALYYLPRLTSGKYGPAERVDVAGMRYLVRIAE